VRYSRLPSVQPSSRDRRSTGGLSTRFECGGSLFSYRVPRAQVLEWKSRLRRTKVSQGDDGEALLAPALTARSACTRTAGCALARAETRSSPSSFPSDRSTIATSGSCAAIEARAVPTVPASPQAAIPGSSRSASTSPFRKRGVIVCPMRCCHGNGSAMNILASGVQSRPVRQVMPD